MSAEQDFARLLACFPDRLKEAVADPQFKNADFFNYLLHQIEQMRCQQDRSALPLASFAVRLAAGLGDLYFSAAIATWSKVNEASAGKGRLLLALVDPGQLGRRQLWHLAREGRFDEARRAALLALLLAQRKGGHDKGCALVDFGLVHELAGEFGEAACRLMEALYFLDVERDEVVYSRAVQGLANAILRYDEVRRSWANRLIKLRRMKCQNGSRQWFHLRWLEGLIYKKRGSKEHAFSTLRSVWSGLAETGDPLELCFAAVDFADACALKRRTSYVPSLFRDTIMILKASKLEREITLELRRFAAAPNDVSSREKLAEFRDRLYRHVHSSGSELYKAVRA